MSLRAMLLENVQFASSVRPGDVNPRLYPTDCSWQDVANNREVRILKESQYQAFLVMQLSGTLDEDITLIVDETAIDAELTGWGAMDTVYSIDYPALAAQDAETRAKNLNPAVYGSGVSIEEYLVGQAVAGVSSITPTRLAAADMLARWEARGYGN